jgi:hypothetical protein
MDVTSTHHQAMAIDQDQLKATDGYVFMLEYHDYSGLYGMWAEGIRYPNAVCFQPHPEYQSDSRMAEVYFEEVEKLFSV